MRLIDTGAYRFRLEYAPPALLDTVRFLYGEGAADDRPADFRIGLHFDAPLRRLFKPQVTFRSGALRPFKPVALSQAYPVLEWGMNWCIGSHEYTKLIVHAAVLVKNGQALIFPAEPGSGKSTLAAYLALKGWRLYSDEMALITPGTTQVTPMYRPVCLKNESIDLVKTWFPEAALTPRFADTVKGDVSHLRVVDRATFGEFEPAQVIGIVFPQFVANAELSIEEPSATDAFKSVVEQTFNYHMLGESGFNGVATLINATRQLRIRYGDLKDVAAFLEEALADNEFRTY